MQRVDESDGAFAWLFLDWRNRAKAPTVVVTTTDRRSDKVSVKSLDALKLKVGK